MYIKVNQLFQVCPNDLISVDEDHFLEVHGEEHVEEQDLISPDDPLFFSLLTEPRRPLVCYELILESIDFGKVGYKFLGKTSVKASGKLCAPPTKKDGERKFSMNQNLTVLLVFFRTLRIIMETKR